jgi:hypothetical protein
MWVILQSSKASPSAFQLTTAVRTTGFEQCNQSSAYNMHATARQPGAGDAGSALQKAVHTFTQSSKRIEPSRK